MTIATRAAAIAMDSASHRTGGRVVENISSIAANTPPMDRSDRTCDLLVGFTTDAPSSNAPGQLAAFCCNGTSDGAQFRSQCEVECNRGRQRQC